MSDASDVLRVAKSNGLVDSIVYFSRRSSTSVEEGAAGRRVSYFKYADGSQIVEANEHFEPVGGGTAEKLFQIEDASFLKEVINKYEFLEFDFDGGTGYRFKDGSVMKIWKPVLEAADAEVKNDS
jgi:hypothetical protein